MAVTGSRYRSATRDVRRGMGLFVRILGRICDVAFASSAPPTGPAFSAYAVSDIRHDLRKFGLSQRLTMTGSVVSSPSMSAHAGVPPPGISGAVSNPKPFHSQAPAATRVGSSS